METRGVPGALSEQVEQESAVCPCSRGGQLHAALPEEVKGADISSSWLSKTHSGVLCACVGPHERHGHVRVNPAEAMVMGF